MAVSREALRKRRVLWSLLREVRREAGLRQADVATKLGVPQSFVSNYESGERRLDILELREICDALATTLPNFIQRLEKKLKG
jgi:transcriptional regulator with XRE-family HTH domain